MPELPEVETTRRGIAPHLVGEMLLGATVRQAGLRQRVPDALSQQLTGRHVLGLERRAKYLLLRLDQPREGGVILHLGMSGSLRILPADTPPGPHDHLDLRFNDRVLRYRDPRRFGLVLWTEQPFAEHPLLRHLGPEPLTSGEFTGARLHKAAIGRRVAVKNLIMDNRVVVGVGNIYASESLFLARIDPRRACNRIAAHRYETLAICIRSVLTKAIEAGGTTLRDFHHEDGKPGYFSQQLNVYNRAGEPCPCCGEPIRSQVIGQRSSFFCVHCQR